MSRTVPLQEGDTHSLADLLPPSQTAEEREALRVAAARLGLRLRVELGLRQDALSVEETADGTVLRTRGVAGTISLGRLTFDIRPKHVTAAEDTTWQRALTVMLDRSSRRRVAFARSHRLGLQPRTFIDQLAMSLALELNEATRHAEVRAYHSERAELPQLRGRLLVSEQLRYALLKPHKVVCEVDELSADNPVNHLLHWAVLQLSTLAIQPSVRHALSVQGARLPFMTQPVRPPSRLIFHLPRQYHHYAGAVDLAVAFARGLTALHGTSNIGGAGFLVGTERLFESFLERSIEVSLAGDAAWRVEAQKRSRYAVPVDSDSGDRAFYSTPDNLVRHSGGAGVVVDAKYKRFDDEIDDTAPDRPANGDLYQWPPRAWPTSARVRCSFTPA